MSKKDKSHLTLFLSTFYISAFTFGGGYAIVPLMKKKFADELGWIEENEMLDLVAIAQSTPGAMAVNTSILVGYRVQGVTGAVISTLGTIMPPLIIISVISVFYTAFKNNQQIAILLKSMQVGVAAVIFDVVLNLANTIIKTKSVLYISIMIISFIFSYFLKVNVVYIILTAAIIGIVHNIDFKKNKKNEIKNTLSTKDETEQMHVEIQKDEDDFDEFENDGDLK